MAVTVLKKVQLGSEVTWGTSVAATAKLMALEDASFTLHRENYRPEFLGRLDPGAETALVSYDWSGNIDVAGTYEDLPYFLDALYGEVSATGTGPYVYTYAAPTTAVPTSPRICTIEYGATDYEYELDGGLCTGLNISIEQGQAWRVSSEWMGQTVAASALASLSDRTVNLINTADTSLYIDAYAGTFGSTAVASTLISAEIELTTGRHLKRFVGDAAPGNWGEGKFDSTMTIVCEFNATSKAYLDAMLIASVSKAVRISATSGANIAQLDFSGVIDGDVDMFEDRDGNVTVSFTLVGRYDGTNTMWFDAEITNSVSALP